MKYCKYEVENLFSPNQNSGPKHDAVNTMYSRPNQNSGPKHKCVFLPLDIMYVIFEILIPPTIDDVETHYTDAIKNADKILFTNIRNILSVNKTWRFVFTKYVQYMLYKRYKISNKTRVAINVLYARNIICTINNVDELAPAAQKIIKTRIKHFRQINTYMLNKQITAQIYDNESFKFAFGLHVEKDKLTAIVLFQNAAHDNAVVYRFRTAQNKYNYKTLKCVQHAQIIGNRYIVRKTYRNVKLQDLHFNYTKLRRIIRLYF